MIQERPHCGCLCVFKGLYDMLLGVTKYQPEISVLYVCIVICERLRELAQREG